MSGTEATSYGGNGGTGFALRTIREIGLRSGREIDALILNGYVMGGNGGSERPSITLEPNEYIDGFTIRAGDRIDYLQFTTNKGRSIEGGGGGGKEYQHKMIRVVAIGGRYGKRLDKLHIKYITGYKPSTVLEEKARFILSYTAPGTECIEHITESQKMLESYEKVTEHMSSIKLTAGVEAEYIQKATATLEKLSIETEKRAKIHAESEYESKENTTITIKRAIESSREKETTKTTKIPENCVGISTVTGTIMRSEDANGERSYWMFPTSSVSYSIVKMDSIENVAGYYDLSGGQLSTQIPDLNKCCILAESGYVYYTKMRNS